MRVPIEWLKEYVDIRQKPERLAYALTMAGLEVEAVERVGPEAIFDIGVTPNRADCLSILGIAREAAVVAGARFVLPTVRAPKGCGAIRDRVSVRVRHATRCPRYCGRLIEGVTIAPSPGWIVRRLAACGIRQINNVVDATNYVMLEMGQPLHAFDASGLRGGAIVVQTAEAAMVFRTLDGIEREVLADDLLICDGEGPVALAGIMGGHNSEVQDATTAIFLESACFEPRGVRRTSRRLGLSSESSRRFERGVDPNGTLAALHRLTEIILQTAGGTPTADWIDAYPKRRAPRRIAVAETEAARMLGTAVSTAQMTKIFRSLGLGVTRGTRGRLAVSVPTFRPDLERPIDLIEEVARIHGYDRISETMPTMHVAPLSRPRFFLEERLVREALVGSGLSEAVLLGFTDEESLAPFGGLGAKPVRIANPLSVQQGVMCTTLLSGLLDAVRLNASRQRTHCRLFALQRVFHRPVAVGPCDEPRMVAGVMAGARFPGAWERAQETIDFYDAKGAVEGVLDALGLWGAAIFQRGEPYDFLHPGAFSFVIVGGRRVGFVGQLHPEVAARWDVREKAFIFELDFEAIAELGAAEVPRYAEPSRYPFVERDVALVIAERIPAVEVEMVIQACGVDIISHVRIFDVYRGPGIPAGHKSLGVTLRFSRNDRTLTEEEVEQAQTRIVEALQRELGAVLRS